MLPGDGPGALAAGACSGDIFAPPDGVGRAACNAGEHGNVVDADGHNRVDDARAEDGGQHDGRENRGEGQREIGQAHDGLFNPAAFGSGQQAQRRADHDADAHGNDADQDRGAGAQQQLRRNIAPIGIGAQPVGQRRPLQLGLHVHLEGRVRRPDIGQASGEQEQCREHQANHEAGVAQCAAPQRVAGYGVAWHWAGSGRGQGGGDGGRRLHGVLRYRWLWCGGRSRHRAGPPRN